MFGNGVGYDSRFLTNDFYTSYGRFGDPINHRDYPNINNLQHWGVAGTLEWKLTDAVMLKAITAYRTFWNKFGRDSDGSPLPVDGTYDDNRHRQFTEEITLTGTVGRLDWATGAFYYDAHDSNRGYNYLYYPFINSQDSFDRQDTTNWAIFAQGTWHATDALSLTLGGRYTDDQKDATISRIQFNGTPDINNQFVPTSATNTDYSVSVNYQWNPDLMTYCEVRHGLQGRRLQPAAFEPAADGTVRPGEAEDAGAGREERAAAAARAIERRVVLLEIHRPADLRAAVRFLGRELVPHVQRRQGAHLGPRRRDPGRAGGQPSHRGLVRLRELRAHRQRRQRAAVRRQHLRAERERALLLTAHAEVQRRGRHLVRVRDGGRHADAAARCGLHRQVYFTTNNGGPQDAYTLLNGRIAWETSDKDWEIALYGRNLTNEEYFNGKLSLIGFFGREQGNPGPPREYGVQFKRNFR